MIPQRSEGVAPTGTNQLQADDAAGTTERPARAVSGYAVAALVGVLALAAALCLVTGEAVVALVGAGLAVVAGLLTPGFFSVAPNETKVLNLLGTYVGTVRRPGFWWANPLTAIYRETVSLRVRNFQSERSKVNDATGSPIEIAAVVVWRVVDTGRAVFDVEDFEQFIVVQSETAVRYLASHFPYDDYADDDGPSLRGNADLVSDTLHREVQARLGAAGIEVIEARLTHLAYAPEIAEAMLRRQQASAIVAARKTIVAGAVGLVDMALQRISEDGIVELDDERKAAMVSNLMVVLTGDRAPTPVINTGSLYS